MPGMRKRIITICSILTLPLLALFAYAESQPVPPPTSVNPPDNTATIVEPPKTSDNTNSLAPSQACDPSRVPEPPPVTDSYAHILFNSTDQPAWATRTDAFYDVQQHNTPLFGLESIQPLYECCRCTLFAQGRAGYTDGGTTFNLGVGSRYLTANKKFMWGLNAFFDEIFRYPHKRLGIGGEVFTPFITLRANYYDAFTGQHYTGDYTYERGSSGFDAGIETPFPYVSWMRLNFKGYRWKGNRAPNVSGGLVSVRAYPARQVEVDVGVADDNSQHVQGFINLNYYFGSPDFIQYSASTPHPSPAFAAQDLEQIHLEKVIRSNVMVVEKTNIKTPRYAVIIASTAN